MTSKWWITLFGALPVAAAMLALQSCGGEGGPIGDDGGAGGLPGVTEQFLALLSDSQRTADYVGSQACVNGTCHGGATDDNAVYKHWQATKHADRGVGCERCHGPGALHVASPSKDNILTFPNSMSGAVCAQCHGPTHDQWLYSAHSKIVPSPVDGGITDPNSRGRTSRCLACHSGLFRGQVYEAGRDPVDMTDDEIRTIAQNTKDLVPHSSMCATCHDPHSKTGNLTKGGKDVQLRHLVFNTDTAPVGPGTAATSFTKFNQICAQCHNGRGANPADTTLNSSTSRPNMHDSNQYNMLMGFAGVEGDGPVTRNTAHANAPGQCTTCHMPGARHSATVGFDGCAPCHSISDAAARVNQTKEEVLGRLLALRTRMENWAFGRFGDRDFWNYSSLVAEEGKTAPPQSQIPIQVKRARHNYFFVVRDASFGVHNAPYANHLITVANNNLAEIGAGPADNGRVDMNKALEVIRHDRELASRADIRSMDE